MKDYLTIGSTPCDEDCAQVGAADYSERSRLECKVFRDQIARHYPEPENGYLSIKRFSHDFGDYREVCAIFDDNDEAACTWAYDVEADQLGVLITWDEIALAELNTAAA
jgi:hypothetical protein